MEIIYKRRIKIQYRVFVIALSIVFIFSSVFGVYCQTVYAASEAIPVLIEELPRIIYYLQMALSLGDGLAINSEFVQDFYDSNQERINNIRCTQNSDGTVTFSPEALKQLREIFDEYLADHPEAVDVVWIPVITEKSLKASWFSSTDDYNRAISLFGTHDLVGFYRNEYSSMPPLSRCAYFDMDDVVLYANSNFSDSLINGINYLTSNFGNDTTTGLQLFVNFADKNGVIMSPYPPFFSYSENGWTDANIRDSYQRKLLVNPFFMGSTQSTANKHFILCSSSGSNIRYVPFFSSLNSYKNWITGNGNYYRFESGYTGGDITINPDADYSEIINAIKSAMLQSIESGKNISEALSAMQSAFISTLDKINGTLGDISDNTAAMNEWLEKIYQKLSEIYNTDDDNDSAFDLLFSGLRSMTVLMELYDTHMDDRFLRLEALLYSYFSSASENLEESKGFLENISHKLDDIYKKLKQILFVESADLAWDILSKLFDSINDWIKNKFSEFGILAAASTVGDVMKTKFPFSIPWDIYAILLMFDAPPKPPVISLHFEFPFIEFEWDYEYVMDDKAWSDLAMVCRFFLTIGYEITLIHLTQKLYAAGLFDTPSIGRKKH